MDMNGIVKVAFGSLDSALLLHQRSNILHYRHYLFVVIAPHLPLNGAAVRHDVYHPAAIYHTHIAGSFLVQMPLRDAGKYLSHNSNSIDALFRLHAGVSRPALYLCPKRHQGRCPPCRTAYRPSQIKHIGIPCLYLAEIKERSSLAVGFLCH